MGNYSGPTPVKKTLEWIDNSDVDKENDLI